ncbi:MAG: CDP-alcohol phosphatidyltransferase family protein [Actinobacteria bacterium]|nr:CDP-alcohol phosphatidyltransferase family protein [Actinomycetota bacterium]
MNSAIRSLIVNEDTSLAQIVDELNQRSGDLLLLDSRTVLAEPHIELLTDYPRKASAALVAVQKNGDTLSRQNRVASASSASHKVTIGNRDFVGALFLSRFNRIEIIETLNKAAGYGAKGHALDLALVALVRAAIRVDAVDIWGAPYSRNDDAKQRAEIKKEIDNLNIERVRLSMVNRANDGFFSVFFLRKFSKILTWVAVRIGATPNQVTLLSFAIGLYSAYSFSKGEFVTTLIGALLLQLSIIVDCVDGELARYTRKFSSLGAWLDAVTDRVKEYLVFFGLAYGAAREGKDLWLPAILMMLIQTFRHLTDYNFAQSVKIRNEELLKVPVEFMAEFDGIIPSERLSKGRLRYWLGKIIQFPIGERWLVISATAVMGGATFTFTAMPILALISAIVVYRGQIIRTGKMERTRLPSNLIINQLDLLGIKKTLFTRSSWIEPSIWVAIESFILISIFQSQGLMGANTFLLLFAILFHHYDSLYRALQNEKKPIWLQVAGLYLGGRVLVIGILLILGLAEAIPTWYFTLLFVFIASGQWVLSHKQNKVSE